MDSSPVCADKTSDVPRERDSAWDGLIGIGIAAAFFAAAWFLVHAAQTVGWL